MDDPGWLAPILAALLLTGPPGAGAVHDLLSDQGEFAPIQPGMKVLFSTADDSSCTMGFLFRSRTNGTLYGSTAGHCIWNQSSGQGVWQGTPRDRTRRIGTLVAATDRVEADWALIRLHDDVLADVTPSVRHWTGPTGLPSDAVIDQDEVTCQYGWGFVYRHREATRHRCGRFDEWEVYRVRSDVTWFSWEARTWGGDSGSPVIHYETGRALGLDIFTTTFARRDNHGITVCGIITDARSFGYDLELVTASYDPPPADLALPRVVRVDLNRYEGGPCPGVP